MTADPALSELQSDRPSSTSHLVAHVERLGHEDAPVGRSRALLDPWSMEQHRLAPGDVVELVTPDGRTALVRLESPRTTDTGSGVIRLDRYLRQALRARLNSPLSLLRVDVSPVRQLFLLPPLDFLGDHHLSERLRDKLAEERVPVSPGIPLYLPISDSTAGALFRVARVDDGPGVVGPQTRVFLEEPNEEMLDVQVDVTLDDVGGLDQEIHAVRELVQLPLQWPAVYRQLGIQAPRGIILYGPPGTGKTHLCRALAHELDVRFYYVNGPEIVGTMHGETEATLRKLFGEASHHGPSIICIDELDAIARSRRELGSQSDVRAVTQLLSLMDGLRKIDGVIVIGTTNQLQVIDPAFRRSGRFDREIYIGPPDAQGRLQILRIHTREMPLDQEATRFLPTLAERTHGFVGADLVELSREAGLASLRRHLPAGDVSGAQASRRAASAIVTVGDLEHARARVRPSAGRHNLAAGQANHEEVAGLETQLDWLRRLAVERLRAEFSSAMSQLGGVLLYGPPGCGKTLLAHALAAEFKPTFIVVHGPEIFSKWLGDTEEAVRHVFDLAQRMPPALIFFDQLEAIAPRRGDDSGSRTTDRVVGQLLTELDELAMRDRVLVLAATNRPDLVDPSVLRAGRIGIHVCVPLPGIDERRQQITLFCRQLGLVFNAENIDWLAGRTEGFSGADLKLVISLAEMETDGRLAPGGIDIRPALERALTSAAGTRSVQPTDWAGRKTKA